MRKGIRMRQVRHSAVTILSDSAVALTWLFGNRRPVLALSIAKFSGSNCRI